MLSDDITWLGKEYGQLAPRVRAGLGMLLASGDWTWWHRPDTTYTAMQQSARRSGILHWGGDAAVLSAHQWLPAPRAHQLAAAFDFVLGRLNVPRLRIGREVWDWDTADRMEGIRNDLAKVIPRERIFCEWPSDTGRRFGSDQAIALSTTERNGTGIRTADLLAEASPDARWEHSSRFEIAIGSLAELLSRQQNVQLAIVLEDDADLALKHAAGIRRATSAACALRIGSNLDDIRAWLAAFADAWLNDNPVDDALLWTNRLSAMQGEIIASTTGFIVGSRHFFNPSFGARSVPHAPQPRYKTAGPVQIADIADINLPPVVRVLHADVMQAGDYLDMFPRAGLVQLLVNIQPKSPLHGARPAFPDHEVYWKGDSKRLQVHMTELGKPPVTVLIDVPRTGASPFAQFHYNVMPAQPIDLRFLVSDGARIVQTARMQGEPGSAISFFIEAINTPLELDKPSFDLAMLVNDSLGGQPSATVLSSGGISLTVLDGHDIVNARRDFLETLQTSVKFPSKDIVDTLFKLASKGRTLFKAIKTSIPEWPAQLKRVQLMTPSNAFFPIEYLYCALMPENTKAGLCPDRAGCLAAGVARNPCSIRENATSLCPMNFLGVTTVVERQTWDPTKPKSVFLSEPKQLAERHCISDLSLAAFAASNRADDFADSDLAPGFAPVRLAQLTATLGPAQPSWDAWKRAVRSNPALLVLIPHVDGEKLQIAQNEELLRGAIEVHHVGQGRPLVVAIGCNSGEAPVPTSSLPLLLMDAGAGAVIAALTEVLGRYTNAATLSFVEGLRAAAAGTEAVSIGSVVNRIRRELLAKDSVFGMVLVAFGDADYALGGTQVEETLDV